MAKTRRHERTDTRRQKFALESGDRDLEDAQLDATTIKADPAASTGRRKPP